MAKIEVLDKHLAELIAAGEVVERPAAVIKELTENSIDAGASQITVEIRGGGFSYMRVSDNGSGIEKEDIAKAFLRHATSKISNQDDLARIATLGFRGEALASIAAMCKVELQSRTKDSQEGVRYVIHGGQELENQPVGCPKGTTIIVKDIFYNTPARMKFLKKDSAEGSAIAAVVEKQALAHPEISFKLIREGQVKLHTPGDGKLLSAIHSIGGREVTDSLLEVDYEFNFVKVKGYVTKPAACRSNRLMQNFFINKRYVKTRTAAAALEEAYKHSVMTGKFPGCFLDISLAYQNVDVNVHPAKTEVRFSNEKAVYEAVYYGVRSALSGASNTGVPQQPAAKKPINPYVVDKQVQNPVQQRFTAQQYRQMVGAGQPAEPPKTTQKVFAADEKKAAVRVEKPATPVLEFNDSGTKPAVTAVKREFEKSPAKPAVEITKQPTIVSESIIQKKYDAPPKIAINENIPAPVEPKTQPVVCEDAKEDRFAGAKLMGEVFSTYILLETQKQLIFIDKHAAHERLRFDRLVKQVENGERQVLLMPVVVHLPSEVYSAASENIDKFMQVGILAEDFGDGAIIVREMPLMLHREDVASVAEEVAIKLAKHRQDLTPEAVYEILHSTACRGSVMAGEKSELQELSVLLDMLRKNEDVKFCPHGRPVEVCISKYELEKRFGRLG